MTNAGFIPVTLSMVPSSYYTFPYLIALLVVTIVIVVLLLISPSLRQYRRKRNIVIYAAVMLVMVLLVFQIDNVSRRAIVDYGFGASSKTAYLGEVNQVDLSCHNHGDRVASFYLVISSVNASFQVQAQQNYVQVNSQTVKVPFLLRENWFSMSADSKPVFFTVDENVTSFSFSIITEPQGSGGLDFSMGTTSATFVWTETENCYVMKYLGGFVV